jgi:DNA-binding transcriptional LysR family regulator
MLDLRSLELVRAVAESGSFARAALRLHYTQPAVSQRIAALERELGVELFERTSRGVVPTEAGRILFEHAQRIVPAVEGARADMAAVTADGEPHLRLGSFPTATAGPVGEAVEEFTRAQPDVDVQLVSGEPFELLPELVARRLDLAVVFRYPGLPAAIDFDGTASVEDGDVELVPLGEDPLQVALPPGHSLARRSRIRCRDLLEERIIPMPPIMPAFPGVEDRLGFSPRFVPVRTADYSVVERLVAAGLGLALVPRLALNGLAGLGITVRPLADVNLGRQILAALPASPMLSSPAASFLDRLRTTVERAIGPPAR